MGNSWGVRPFRYGDLLHAEKGGRDLVWDGWFPEKNEAGIELYVSIHFYNAQSWTKQLMEIGIESEGQTITNLEDLYIKY